jgi:hypothetical protein
MRDIRIDLFDVIPYLEDKGIFFSTEGPNVTPGWIELNCLWCSDRSQHLGIHLQSNVVNCWRCGKHSILSLVRVLENNCGFSEALSIMEKYQDNARLSQSKNEPSFSQSVNIPPQFQELVWPKVSSIVTNFLAGRGFDPEQIIRNKKLYYGGIIGDFRHRLILPVYFRHSLASFLGKGLGKNTFPPYKNLEDKDSVIPIKSTLYGYDDCPPGGTVVVVEGPIDQWKLGNGSVATYGTAWTLEQVALLRTLKPNKIMVLYDSEPEAQQQADKLMRMIHFCDVMTGYLEGIKDPGELTIEEGKKLMEELK